MNWKNALMAGVGRIQNFQSAAVSSSLQSLWTDTVVMSAML